MAPWEPSPTRSDADRCVPAADLTAFAMDALPAARRAAISRHLLRCGACRASLDRDESVLRRLRGLSASPSWEDDLAAAHLAQSARVRARRRGALSGAAAAAALAAALFAWPAGPSSSRSSLSRDAEVAIATVPEAPALPRLSTSAEAALLRAQASDGRWHATTGDEQHDLGATGLAVLALAKSRSDVLRAGTSGPVVRAVADGVRWISLHVDDSGRDDEAIRRDRAVVAEALREVYAATGDRSLRAVLDRARRSASPDGRDAAVPSGVRSVLASASTVLAFVDATPAR